jgi:hypothetical protein
MQALTKLGHTAAGTAGEISPFQSACRLPAVITDLHRLEYEALRSATTHRGTVRVWLFWTSMAAWGAAFLYVFSDPSLPRPATLVSLLILVAGFEAVAALHFGVERIGRYLQAAYEDGPGFGNLGPGWETTVMEFGRRYESAGLDPLFAVIFSLAALVNVLPVVTADSGSQFLALVAAHILFVARVIRIRRAARRQRQEDLDRFRQIIRAAP